MAETAFTPALEGIKHVKSEDGEILTGPFLHICKHILPVIDKFGASMAAIVKSDIGGNISRLETKYSSDPAKYNLLYTMIKEEVEAKTAKESSSCTNGLLWLTRAIDFIMALVQNLFEHADWSMSQCCTDSYTKTIKKWHGWLASTTTTVAMKLGPDRNKFMDALGSGDDVKSDIEKFLAAFPPILAENHKFLVGEVGELSEIFKWRGEVDKGLPNWEDNDKEHLGEELSDVLLYLIRLADICGIDLSQVASSKIIKNAIKFPPPPTSSA